MKLLYKKIAVLVIPTIVFVSVLLYSMLSYHRVELSYKHVVWIDGQTNEIVVNFTEVTHYTYLWKEEETTATVEDHRDEDASRLIQWAIDNTYGLIEFQKGEYWLNQTVQLDSFTKIYGGIFTGDVEPFFAVSSSCEYVVFQNVTVIKGQLSFGEKEEG